MSNSWSRRGDSRLSRVSRTGKSVALRIVAGRLSSFRDVTVGVIERPQSRSPDFYRELGDIFAVKLAPHNRWCGFKALRERWKLTWPLTDPAGALDRQSEGDEPQRPF